MQTIEQNLTKLTTDQLLKHISDIEIQLNAAKEDINNKTKTAALVCAMIETLESLNLTVVHSNNA